MRFKILILSILFPFVMTYGQCDYEVDTPIPDLTTFQLDLIVDNAANNQLGIDNCLKSVRLHFTHAFITDLSIELISPSGQSFELIGGNGIGANTGGNRKWEVQIINEEELVAMPDPDHGDVWNSNTGWIDFTTFEGLYYPFQGNLDDYTGSVNGIWAFKISDESLFGTGEITCIGLEFCNEDMIEIYTCSPVENTLQEDDFTYCVGDQSLDLTISPVLQSVYDSSLYNYTYLFYEDGGYTNHGLETDYSAKPPGSYTICGVHYLLEEESVINDIPAGSSIATTQEYLTSSEICGLLSSECVNILINPIPDTITSQQTICIGDTVFIGSELYTETGVYEIFSEVEPCDSVSFLDLTVISMDIDLVADITELSCENDTLLLDARGSSLIDGATTSWTTVGGQFVTNPSADSVLVNGAGIYTYQASNMGCVFSEEIEITENEDFVLFSITAEDITCVSDSAFVDLVASDSIIDISWTGNSNFVGINEDIKVGVEGTYKVDFETEFGCIISSEVFVEDIREFPVFVLESDTLSCENTTATINTVNEDTLNSNFIWIKDGEVIGSNDPFIDVTAPGIYDLRVTTGAGCIDTFSIDVINIADTLEVDLIGGGTLPCDATETEIAYISTSADLNVLWTLPDNSPLVDSAFFSGQIGTYQLELEDSNKCTLDTFLVVSQDLNIPSLSIPTLEFQCGQDSIQIIPAANLENLDFLWTNEGGFIDTSSTPWIFNPGEYYVEACTEIGCCTRDTFVVSVDQELPVISFDFGNINCINETVFITPSDTSSYTMDWSLNGSGITVDSNIIMVADTGLYEVIVTNEDNGCSSSYSFDIKDDRDSELGELSANVINCINETVQIQVETDKELNSFSWDGPGLLDSNLEPMVNLAGEYIITYELINGCTGKDTIQIISEGELPNLQGNDAVLNCFSPTVPLSVTFESSSIFITWEGPGFTAEGPIVTVTQAGIYTAFAVAPGACRDTIQLEVVADTISPVLSIVDDGTITCADSIVQVILTIDDNTSSYTFEGPGILDQDETIINVDKPGIYTATGVADNGCKSTVSTQVDISNDFPDYTILLDSITCVEEVIDVGFTSTDPSLDVIWQGPEVVSDDAYTFSTNQAGNYIFSLTNSDGCEISDSFFVVRDTFAPEGSILLSNQITCDFDNATLTVENENPAWSYLWTGTGVISPDARTITTNKTGIYTLQITDVNGCTTQDALEVVYDTLSPVIQILGDNISCTAGKVFLRVDSDLELVMYEWEGPSFSSNEVEPLVSEPGTYTVTVTSLNGCQSTAEKLVEDIRIFPEIEIPDFYLPCDGAPSLATYSSISEGAFVRWFGPNDYFSDTDTASILIEGEYVGVAITSEGCSSSDTFLVIDEPIFPEFSAEGNTLLCFGGVEITGIDIEDDRSFEWSGPNGFQSSINPAIAEESGDYTLTVEGTNGCISNTIVTVEEGRVYPEAMTEGNNLFQCDNITVNISGIGSSIGDKYTHQWSTPDGNIINGENTLTPLIMGVGSYILQVTNTEIGCITIDTLELTLQPQDFIGADIEITPPTCVDFENAIIEIKEFLGGYGPYEITLDDTPYGERMDIPYLDIGEYNLRIVDSLGCIIDTLLVIDESNLLMIDLPEDTTLIFGQNIDVDPMINLPQDSIMQITWSSNVPCDGCRLFDFVPEDNMTIAIEVVDINGCIVTDEFRVTVNRPNRLPFPQIFSPNGDGINDIFYMPMTLGLQVIDYIRIYDNWGGLLYEGSNLIPGDPSFGWDGVVNGQNAEMAVYIVEAVVTLVDGKSVRYVGDLTLIR